MGKLTLVAAGLVLCGTAMASKPTGLTAEEEMGVRAVAYSTAVAQTASTNCLAFAAALEPKARARWSEEEPALRIRGVQCFLPDFFKVVYVYTGGVSGDSFCFGLYNPFYDHMLLSRVQIGNRTHILDYKWIAGEALRDEKDTPAYPLATSVTSFEGYFPSLLKVSGGVVSSFRMKFDGTNAMQNFKAMPTLDQAGKKRMLDIAQFRVAQVSRMVGGKSSFGLMALANAVLTDAKRAGLSCVGDDATTAAVMKMLSGLPEGLRGCFKPIGYSEPSDGKCITFYNTSMPTLLVTAYSANGNVIRFSMFDARIADGWENKVSK